MTLEFTDYARKPFVVEAVEVTEDNLEEIAKYVGEIEKKEDGTRFIRVDRRLVPNIYKVFPGFYMTRMGDHIRCYNKKVFKDQFTELTPDIKTWVEFMAKEA